MQVPMSQKYVDEAFGVYFIYGSSQEGQVDVHSNGVDLMSLQPDIAAKVVQMHAEFRSELYALLCHSN